MAELDERQRIATAALAVCEWWTGPRGGTRWRRVAPDEELTQAIEAFRKRKLAGIDARLPQKRVETIAA